ncbi:MAG TPA: MATE family efflux transporter [Succinivibrionaceae bacterium]|nr:MATE family efflux transporter [Succinivibrionaceae bacterium]
MRKVMRLGELLKTEDASKLDIVLMVLRMSIPAILSQITFIAMMYIDATMVGSLGASASASVGLVSSATWLLFGITMATTTGFAIIASQKLGAEKYADARSIMRQDIMLNCFVGLLVMGIGLSISDKVPLWMRGNSEIIENSASYFRILMFSIPLFLMRMVGTSLVQATGNMKVPSLTSAATCLLDIFWNFWFIFPVRTIELFNFSITIPGAGLGVSGAALGTTVAEAITSAAIIWYLLRKSELKLKENERWSFKKQDLAAALKLGFPIGLENAVMTAAMVATTRIIAPLGTVAIAANAFAIQAEGLCYMPGYGIGSAITPIIGQCMGAKREDLIKRCSKYGILLGAVIMGICGIIMFFICPLIFMMFTPDHEVRELGVKILRIEMLAEPMFGVSIVATAALRGMGDTLIPSILNAFSIWGIRISLCLLLVSNFGLTGAWIAMCIELCCRGLIMLLRFSQAPWKKLKTVH